MSTYRITKHCLLNGFIISTLESEYEKLRQCFLDHEANSTDGSTALKWFTKYGAKLNQARRLKARLAVKAAAVVKA